VIRTQSGTYRITALGAVVDEPELDYVTKVTCQVNKGDNYPDWRYRLANGLQCTTTLTGTDYSVTSTPYMCIAGITDMNPYVNTATVYWQAYGQNRLSGFSSLSDSVNEGTANNLALGNFNRRVRAARTHLQGGVVLGEMAETIALIKSPARSLMRGLKSYLTSLQKRKRSIRRSPLKKRLRVAKDILADTWLEYSFGWKPLLHDINDAAKLLAIQHAKGTLIRTPVSASGVDEVYVVDDPNFSVYAQGPINLRAKESTRSKVSVKYYGQVRVDTSNAVSWHQAGFSLDDVFPTVWELIPYSFLVDYFTNIGDIISAASTFNSGLLWTSKTVVKETFHCLTDFRLTPTVTAGVKRFYSLKPGEEEWYKRTVSRAPYIGSLVPSLQFTLPGTGTRWLNIAALLATSKRIAPYHR
jgi:hypothetical protein